MITKQTLENLVDNQVLNYLKEYYYASIDGIIDLFEPLCDYSEDLDEIINIIKGSKRYNYILLENCDSYIVGRDKQSMREFLEDMEISYDDDVWGEYFYYGMDTLRLREIMEDTTK